jgi:hypothetical protein
VANTPLGAALDLMQMRTDVNTPAEVVIVMMTPWLESDKTNPNVLRGNRPGSFGDAMNWVLDWMMLSSFRENLKMIQAFNQLAELDRREGRQPRYRTVKYMIVAPRELKKMQRIIDYDGKDSEDLMKDGYNSAEEAFKYDFRT